ncbi:hypothetical protein N7517_000658 [Penicillium concentricum]|uniref:Uncharacterized protein n=1 Tax=Penicillium concentricum TaxID=293559 RepID=A0A9W9SQF4_9EURO|nr:uncharacterized protein N7517_000658 [Penicillium concentricum]KAJ5382747.1 hypothetical protein N7517_000658 [Penicillium concentricum]
MAPPGIEPGLKQDQCTHVYITTMLRHTTRPWHLLDERRNLFGSIWSTIVSGKCWLIGALSKVVGLVD